MNPDIALLGRILAGGVALPALFDSSPIARALGMTILSVDKANGDVLAQFAPEECFVQGAGVLQGGAVAAMLDYAMIIPVMALADEGTVPATTNLDTAFFRPAPRGVYRAVARARRRTRMAVFVEATLRDSEEREIAAATATVMISANRKKPGTEPGLAAGTA